MDNAEAEAKAKRRKRDAADTRAERKRELDRIAQRATRERTKNRIADLEQRLASLESGDKNGEIAQLTKTIGELRNDNGKYQNALMKMRFAINEALAESEASTRRDSTSTISMNGTVTKTEPQSGMIMPENIPQTDEYGIDGIVTSTSVVPISSQEQRLQNFYQASGFNPPDPTDFTHLDFSSVFNFFSFENATTNAYMVPSPLNMRMPPTGDMIIAPDELKWKTSDDAFHKTLAVRTINGDFDEGSLVRAIYHGWDSIGSEGMHPVFVALREVDQRVFGKWTFRPQRLAVMYLCAVAMRWRMNPTQENKLRIPAWYLPRPAQDKIQHPLVIDFLVWPGLRERLVFEYERYTATGEFSFAFVEFLHFNWPFAEEQVAEFDSMTGVMVRLSKLFKDYAYDLKNWTMMPPFFELFPEMKADIEMWQDPTITYQKGPWT